jgi:Ca2+-binding RTX toxin-like protein
MDWYQGLRDAAQGELVPGGFAAGDFGSDGLHNLFVAVSERATIYNTATQQYEIDPNETDAHVVDREGKDSSNIMWSDGFDDHHNGMEADRNNDLILGSLDDANPGQFADEADTLKGGLGNDVIIDDGGNDQLYGGDGNDLIIAGEGLDTLDGGDGDDALLGGMAMTF